MRAALTPLACHRGIPNHSAHHEPSRSKALLQGGKVGAWWLVRVRGAELLRACCAKRLGLRVYRGELWAPRSLALRLGEVASRVVDYRLSVVADLRYQAVVG